MQLGKLRTKNEEELIQEGTLEQLEWKRITWQHHLQEVYAKDAVRRFLGVLEKCRANNPYCECHGNGTLHVLEIIADRQYVEDVLRVWQVEHTHVEMAADLVQAISKVRAKERLGIQG